MTRDEMIQRAIKFFHESHRGELYSPEKTNGCAAFAADFALTLSPWVEIDGPESLPQPGWYLTTVSDSTIVHVLCRTTSGLWLDDSGEEIGEQYVIAWAPLIPPFEGRKES